MVIGLFIGATALTTMQEGISVIANNIANVNTTAFKSSMVHYSDQKYAQVKFGSAPTSNRGGVNPGRIGTGITLSDINTSFTQGPLKTTGLASDLAIAGDGFFVVTNEISADLNSTSNNANAFNANFTRAGHFLVDANQHLVSADGSYVMGAMLYEPLSGRIKSVDGYQNITYYTDQSVGNINDPKYFPTDGEGNNLPVPIPTVANTSGIGDNPRFNNDLVSEISVRGSVVDPLTGIATGEGLRGNLTVSRQADGKMVITFDDQNAGTADSTFSVAIDTTFKVLDNVLTYNLANSSDEKIQLRVRVQPGISTLEDIFEDINFDPVLGSDTLTFNGDDASTQAGDIMTVADEDFQYLDVTDLRALYDRIKIPNFLYEQDINLELETVNYSIESDGSIIIYGPSSENQKLGRVLMANFSNPDGLSDQGGSKYEESLNSGTAAITVLGGPFDRSAPSLLGTALVAGALETSNVDLANEFAELIQQQRGLQAQSRTISTADEILQTIINL